MANSQAFEAYRQTNKTTVEDIHEAFWVGDIRFIEALHGDSESHEYVQKLMRDSMSDIFNKRPPAVATYDWILWKFGPILERPGRWSKGYLEGPTADHSVVVRHLHFCDGAFGSDSVEVVRLLLKHLPNEFLAHCKRFHLPARLSALSNNVDLLDSARCHSNDWDALLPRQNHQ